MIRPATQAIADACAECDIKYEISERGGTSAVQVNMGLDTTNIRMLFISSDDDNDVAMRVYHLAKLPENRRGRRIDLLETINRANAEHRFLKFCLNAEDEVGAEVDFPISTGDVGVTAMEYIKHAGNIIDLVFPEIMKAIWSDDDCGTDADDEEESTDRIPEWMLDILKRDDSDDEADDVADEK